MMCPCCGYENSLVLESRPCVNGEISRRRECPECLTRWRTYERIDHVIPPSSPDSKMKGETNNEV